MRKAQKGELQWHLVPALSNIREGDTVSHFTGRTVSRGSDHRCSRSAAFACRPVCAGGGKTHAMLEQFSATHPGNAKLPRRQQRLPPRGLTTNNLSWNVFILPHIEQQPLYDQFNLGEGRFNGDANQEGLNKLVHGVNFISAFMRPSAQSLFSGWSNAL